MTLKQSPVTPYYVRTILKEKTVGDGNGLALVFQRNFLAQYDALKKAAKCNKKQTLFHCGSQLAFKLQSS